ncbi:hypothetical protein FB567DRAFT_631898 [Paraphoma chrysanthemicola]|uniref:Fungal N-terminal domain-containing protein n=1 Tax=Paraphoma chrysanthemicola TaxID=798071 RepID=A0A8K0VVM3_9PLEO|nr:hypothetical protein FB567DRAFT_631898 [Paraphoma chrysanthemicola]
MAEVLGIISASITVAGTAAALSRALFDVVETLKHARKEIASIAQNLSFLSGSLHLLADLIRSQQSICRPALFANTEAIIQQYRKLEGEIKKLLQTPQSLARLSWCIKRNRAKSMLKEVEAIKSSLILEVNIIQLAREETIRPSLDQSQTSITVVQPNRFRKLVESAVQANRQVVESAQREDAKSTSAANIESRVELNLYKEGSFDTATWLYNLVFGSEVQSHEAQSTTTDHSSYQAYVSDREDPDDGILHAPVVFGRQQSNVSTSKRDHRALIVWNHHTDPVFVVDRLLSSWTTLTNEQIELSSTRTPDDAWNDSVVQMANEAKKDDPQSFGNYEESFDLGSSDEDIWESLDHSNSSGSANKNYRGKHPEHQVRADRYRSTEAVTPAYDLPKKDPAQRNRTSRARKTQKTQSKSLEPDPWSFSTSEDPPGHNPFAPNYPMPSAFGPQSGQAPFAPPGYRSPFGGVYGPATYGGYSPPFSNPFASYASPAGAPLNKEWPGTHGIHSPDQRNPWSPNGEAQPGMPIHPTSGSSATAPSTGPPKESPSSPSQTPGTSANTDARDTEASILATVADLIEKRGAQYKTRAEDPRFEKIMEVLIRQQEQHAEAELERARVAAEVEVKHMLIARDQDIARLEQLIIRHGEEQRSREAAWREERTARDAQAAKLIQDAKEQHERELAAARAAKKAAQKSLKFAKAEAEKRASQEAEANAAKERAKADKKLKDRIESYERLLDAALRNGPLSSFGDGNRQLTIEDGGSGAMEYTEDSASSSSRMKSDKLCPRILSGRKQNINSRTNASWAALQGTQPSTPFQNARPVQTDQQVMLLPSQLDQSSIKTSKLQTSLAEFGILISYHDSDLEMVDGTSGPHNLAADAVRSSIFWEAPSSGTGSELLETYRRCGWRPPYARSSCSGHTYFLGSQPVHSFFFRPDYRPQFSACKPSTNTERIIIDKALIHEYALIELGFAFEATDAGTYQLDGRLQYSDIEALIERSFAMRETHFRRNYRQLDWYFSSSASQDLGYDEECPTPSTARSPGPKPKTTSSNASSNSDHEEYEESSKQTEAYDEDFVQSFRVPDSDDEGVPALTTDTSSSVSPSTKSWSSNNPFRSQLGKAEGGIGVFGSPDGFSRDIWDDPVFEVCG